MFHDTNLLVDDDIQYDQGHEWNDAVDKEAWVVDVVFDVVRVSSEWGWSECDWFWKVSRGDIILITLIFLNAVPDG